MATYNRVFNRARANDVYQSIYILYAIQGIHMVIFVGVAMYFAEWKSVYWLPSIFSAICIMVMTGLSRFLYNNALTFDSSDGVGKPRFMKMMKYHDIMCIITAIVCLIALIIAGWLGFTYGENDTNNLNNSTEGSDSTSNELTDEAKKAADEAANKKDGNGHISGALLGINTLSEMMLVLCLWANHKFRKYLRSNEDSMTPAEYETHIINAL